MHGADPLNFDFGRRLQRVLSVSDILFLVGFIRDVPLLLPVATVWYLLVSRQGSSPDPCELVQANSWRGYRGRNARGLRFARYPSSIVAFDTSNVAVPLSKETLSRMWCACEVVTASNQNVNMVLLRMEDYVPCADDCMEELCQTWDEEQRA